MAEDIRLRAKKYSTIKYTFAAIETLFIVIFLFAFQLSGISHLIKLKLGGITAFYLLALALVYYALNLPLSFFGSFAVERRFNLSNQKIGDWLKDQLKSFGVAYIIFLILVEVFYFILHKWPANWWIIASLFWILFSIILARLTPTLLIPIFFKYKPLSDTALKERITDLAAKMQVKMLDAFEIDFSKKTLKANAAFVGMGKTRRVILADTLKDKYSHDEIEVILAHEFAHYKLKHLWKLIFINSAFVIFSFFVIFKASPSILKVFHFSSLNDIGAFPLLALFMVVIGIVTTPLSNIISCKFERDADRVALEFTGSREAFVSMMEKIAEQNLSDRKPHPLIKLFFFDHPPIDERIVSVKDIK